MKEEHTYIQLSPVEVQLLKPVLKEIIKWTPSRFPLFGEKHEVPVFRNFKGENICIACFLGGTTPMKHVSRYVLDMAKEKAGARVDKLNLSLLLVAWEHKDPLKVQCSYYLHGRI